LSVSTRVNASALPCDLSCDVLIVVAPLLLRGALPKLFPDSAGLLFPPALGRPPWLDELVCVRAIVSERERDLTAGSLCYYGS